MYMLLASSKTREHFVEKQLRGCKASGGKTIQDMCQRQIPHQKSLPREGWSRDVKGRLAEARQRSRLLCEGISFLAASSQHRHTGGGSVTRAGGDGQPEEEGPSSGSQVSEA